MTKTFYVFFLRDRLILATLSMDKGTCGYLEIFPDPFSGGYLMGKFMVLINDFG